MCAMLSFIREWGISTVGFNTRLALRIRVNMSEIVSVIILPTRFGYSRDKPIQGPLSERQARAAELAQVAVAASAHRAAVHQPGWARVARQLRQSAVIALGLHLRPDRGVFLDRFRLPLVSLYPGFLRHKITW